MKYQAFKQKIKKLPLFSSSMLSSLAKDVNLLKVQLSLWKKKGLISALRKGLYVLNPEEREMEPSPFYLANQIFMPSYISLESALAYYGFIPEFVAATTSITVRKTCKFKNEFGLFTYQHIMPEGYTGFETMQETENIKVFIATPEKAIIDFLYLNLSKFSTSDSLIFIESYRFQNCKSLNKRKFRNYAKLFRSKKLILISEQFINEVIK